MTVYRARAGGGLAASCALALLAACAAPPSGAPERGAAREAMALPARPPEAEIDATIAEVTAALRALGPSVDPNEAARAARIAVRKPLDWAREWHVVDSPLAHNFKVVHGLREKGVCQDWADALHAALAAEGLRSLQIHRAMANARNIALEHATVILTARGAPMETGLVLDPWRIGQGRLWFGRVTEDPRYRWESLASVRAWREAARTGF